MSAHVLRDPPGRPASARHPRGRYRDVSRVRLNFGLLFFAPMACVALMLLLILPGRMNDVAHAGAHQRARSVAIVLAKAAAAAVEFEDREHAGEVLATIGGDPEILRAGVRGGDGALLASLPPGSDAAPWPLEGLP